MFEDFRLRVFLEVASRKSFTAAARALGISQPAVSQHISEMERILGVRLFDRTRTEVRLTEEGKRMKGYASQILYWYSQAEADFSGKQTGQSVRLPLGNGSTAEVSASEGNIRISIIDELN